MKVGDIVRYKNDRSVTWIGVVVREIPGWGEKKLIKWVTPKEMITSNPRSEMEVISESR